MSVGERIRYLRKLNGVKSQEELAYLVDTARQTISSWERDICLTEGANLLKLAKVVHAALYPPANGSDVNAELICKIFLRHAPFL